MVNKEGLISLFTSFLTAISTSVHNINTSSKDGNVLSSETTQEILEVATFASDNLIDFATRKGSVQGASFDIFGQWYNSGGFSLVPWLELIDLSKWDYTGIVGESIGSSSVAASTAAAAAATTTATQQQASSNKKARIQQQDGPFTPGVGGMNEPIGSPSTLFAQGANILGPTPNRDQSTSRTAAATTTTTTTNARNVQSFSGMFGAQMDESRTVVSFDFSGSSPTNNNSNLLGNNNTINPPSSFHIDITEENLIMLRNLVRRTGFASLTPQHVESLMMKHARKTKHKYGETHLHYITITIW